MALMQWTDKLAVGVRECDEQHKKLVAMVNDLHDAMVSGKGKDVTGKILGDLIGYCGTHFGMEERLFKTHGYPEFTAHKKEHDDLTQKALALKKDFEAGKPVVTMELMTFLKNWLINHIMGTDKKYGPFLNGKGVS
jgi:hemerythrin